MLSVASAGRAMVSTLPSAEAGRRRVSTRPTGVDQQSRPAGLESEGLTLQVDGMDVGVERRAGLELAAEDVGRVADNGGSERRPAERDRRRDAGPGGGEGHSGCWSTVGGVERKETTGLTSVVLAGTALAAAPRRRGHTLNLESRLQRDNWSR